MLVIQAVSLAVLIFLPASSSLLTRLEAYPRSALFINWFILIALLAGPRVVYRAVLDGSLAGVMRRGSAARRGASPCCCSAPGDNAELFIRATTRSASSSSYRVVGIADDDASKAQQPHPRHPDSTEPRRSCRPS